MTTPSGLPANGHAVVEHDAWLAARQELLIKEKEFTRLSDEMSRMQRDLPWEQVSKDYHFDGTHGTRSLAELFDGRSQLIVYHFMFHPDDKAGCPHCSLRADGFNGIGVHLAQRDVTFAVVSRAPSAKLATCQQRLGWSFPWYSSMGSDFNYDYQASFTPDEMANKRALYNFTMRDPKARDEGGRGPYWVRRHDEYESQVPTGNR